MAQVIVQVIIQVGQCVRSQKWLMQACCIMCLRGYGYLYFKRIYKAKTVYYVFTIKQYMYIWAIDQVSGQDGWILAKFFFCTMPIFSHLDRTSLANKGFVIWLLGTFSWGHGGQSRRGKISPSCLFGQPIAAQDLIHLAREAGHIIRKIFLCLMLKIYPADEHVQFLATCRNAYYSNWENLKPCLPTGCNAFSFNILKRNWSCGR